MKRWNALVLSALAACTTAAPVGGVRVITNVPEATLLVDDELRGPVSAYGEGYLRLPPGQHQITLEHPGYRPEVLEVTVAEDVATEVTVEMRRRRQAAPGDHDNVSP